MKVAKRRSLKFQNVTKTSMDDLRERLFDLGFAEAVEQVTQTFYIRAVSRGSQLWESVATMILIKVVLDDDYAPTKLHVLILETGESLEETIKLLIGYLGKPIG